jgi:hypothetical protein
VVVAAGTRVKKLWAVGTELLEGSATPGSGRGQPASVSHDDGQILVPASDDLHSAIAGFG